MPTVYIWRPQGKTNPFGHVALKTDKFYISFWTSTGFSDDKIEQLKEVFDFVDGVRGAIVFNQNVDRKNENDFDPIEYIDPIPFLRDEDINSIYEEFLRYNEINPEDVTLERGEQLFKKYQEYEELKKSLPREEAKKMKQPEVPEKSLPKTNYSFSVEFVSRKDESEVPFYHQKQSCVSFVFNLIQMAWLENCSDYAIPIFYSDVAGQSFFGRNVVSSDFKYREFPFRVDWFEKEILKGKRWDLDASCVSYWTTTRDPFTLFNLFIVLPGGIFFLILSFLFFFSPFLRYPVLFVGFICTEAFSRNHWILSFFLMLFVYYIYPINHFLLLFLMFCYHSVTLYMFSPPQFFDSYFKDILPNTIIWFYTFADRYRRGYGL
ncbi:uncharacterized protein LOC124316369 [Daphnia pulicaria]|uniref:uncharacterized protein LOC124316369 n=1 Tax=Daphnia pulicaria TaxID=35523 RepID=UPI001EEC821B|nr:uncharacterized protein LOC124316369 [Daphnia pulicaria]